VVLLSGTHLQDNIAHLLPIARIDMVEEVTVTDTWVTGVPATDHLLDGIEAHPEADHHHQGKVGTGGGAEAPHAALSTESEVGEVATAEALYGVVRPLPGNLGHMVSVHGQSPGAACPDRDQGLHHQRMIGLHPIPHLLSMQVMRSPGPHPRPARAPCLQALVLEARKAWFPTEMAPQILLESRGAVKCFYYLWALAVDLSIGSLC
jgi:hypothetical protein